MRCYLVEYKAGKYTETQTMLTFAPNMKQAEANVRAAVMQRAGVTTRRMKAMRWTGRASPHRTSRTPTLLVPPMERTQVGRGTPATPRLAAR